MRIDVGLAIASSWAALLAPVSGGADPSQRTITSLGRLEPGDGVIQVAGPSGPAPVVASLLVEEGDRVEPGQTLARLDSHALRQAELERLAAELENAQRELRRRENLYQRKTISDSEVDEARLAARVARSDLDAAQARLDLSEVRSPIAGQVLEIHAREGERLGAEGLMEIGETGRMYAVAEVYETDIGRVRVGQRARIRSPALPRELEGQVERIGLKIGKKDVLDTDPAARIDARVVEVEILLDDAAQVAGLKNLQVDVAIEP